AIGYLSTLPQATDSGKADAAPSVKLAPPSNPSANPDPNADAGDEDDAAGGGGGGGGGTDSGTPPPADAGGGGGGTDGGPGPGVSCGATNTCMGATDLGSVSGDTGADTKNAQGYTSQWLRVRAPENDTSIFGPDLWMTATLTSPPGTNFDLFVYVPGSDTRECSAVTHASTNSSGTDSATSKFGEGGIANGSDDSR